MPIIETKEKFYRMYEMGFFGNRALVWDSYQELLESNWGGGSVSGAKEFLEQVQHITSLLKISEIK